MPEWREAKPVKYTGPPWSFRRGYSLDHSGMHESDKQFDFFQNYLQMGNRTIQGLATIVDCDEDTLRKYHKRFEWARRAAEYDKQQTALIWKEAEALKKNTHKESILEFRDTSERQARMMARVSEDLMRVLGKKIADAEDKGEEIPMNLVAGLLKAATSVAEQSKQQWANALGINEMVEMVEQEMEKVHVEELTEDDYEIPLDE